MAKINTGSVWKPSPKPKGTSQGKTNCRMKMSSMNKSKKRSYKPNRGQG